MVRVLCVLNFGSHFLQQAILLFVLFQSACLRIVRENVLTSRLTRREHVVGREVEGMLIYFPSLIS
jgi:hypothetical protein